MSIAERRKLFEKHSDYGFKNDSSSKRSSVEVKEIKSGSIRDKIHSFQAMNKEPEKTIGFEGTRRISNKIQERISLLEKAHTTSCIDKKDDFHGNNRASTEIVQNSNEDPNLNHMTSLQNDLEVDLPSLEFRKKVSILLQRTR